MRVFLALLTRTKPTDAMLHRVEALARVSLPFAARPYRSAMWRAPTGRAALWAWDEEADADEELLDIAPDGLSASAWGGYRYMVPNGDASGVTIDGATGSLGASTSLSRLAPVYWTRTDEAWLVSGRALLLARLRSRDGTPAYDPMSLAPLIIDGYFRNDRTPYQGVDVLGPAGTLEVHDDGARTTVQDPAALRCGELVPGEQDLDELMREIRHSVSSSVHGDVVCTLTGGRDSRLVAATLHALGVPFRARTRGAPDHPDVMVAARVAAALGVPHERIPPPTMAREGGDVLEVDLGARTRSVLFACDGMLYAWENALNPSHQPGETGTLFGGGGGESLRGGFAKRVAPDLQPPWDVASDWLRSRYEQYARLFRPGLTDDYIGTLQAWIDADRAAGVAAGVSLDRYFVWYFTGRWKSAFFAAANDGAIRHPLHDDRITRFGLRLAPVAKAWNRIPQELAVRFAPALRDVAYHDKAAGRAAVAAGAHASTTPPPFDWRRTSTDQMYRAFREQVFEGRGATALWTIMDRQRLDRWFREREGRPPARSARVGMFMWGLYTCSVLLSNEWLEPQEGTPRMVRVRIPPGSSVGDED